MHPLFTSVRPGCRRTPPHHALGSAKNKNAITARLLSYRFPATFTAESMNIYESILILHLETSNLCTPWCCVLLLEDAAAARIIQIIPLNEFPHFIFHICTFGRRSQSSRMLNQHGGTCAPGLTILNCVCVCVCDITVSLKHTHPHREGDRELPSSLNVSSTFELHCYWP